MGSSESKAKGSFGQKEFDISNELFIKIDYDFFVGFIGLRI